jgi:2-polyprenyl-6-methoxyphenol hydroxylase-like FAD-dependent oxidoreductase
LFAGLVLARDGHQVVVVDKDARPAPIDAMTVERWQRPGTPQAMLPHGFMARGRALLRVRAPDVLRSLLNAGAIEFALAPFIPGGTPDAEDDELVVIFCRRPLFEGALWRAVEHQHGVELRTETTVTGLTGSTIQTDQGALDADLVIDAAGRRSPLWKWTSADANVDECGMVYYSRYFRLRPGAAPKLPVLILLRWDGRDSALRCRRLSDSR